MSRIIVIGAGIVGLATAQRLSTAGHQVIVLEKDPDVALHQTGRNSGVVHSGLYYTPGSAKARMCHAGSRSMYRFAEDNGIAFKVTGKLVVATSSEQIPALNELTKRAGANGVLVRSVSASEAREIEPAVRSVAGLHVPATGIVDYTGVCRVLAEQIRLAGGEIRLGEGFVAAKTRADGVAVTTEKDEFRVDYLVNCAGLYSDRVAMASGLRPSVRIVPFRGEYFELVKERHDLVNGLIYPVPDPRFPFLGVHLTKMVDGSVHAGPNAVLALAREGYRWRDINVRDLGESLAWPGLWQLGAKNIVPGAKEMVRSASKALFARSLSQLVPGITSADLVPAPAGVRAQALNRDGSLVDDFLVERDARQIHVLNAPSPAATCALEIAGYISAELESIAS